MRTTPAKTWRVAVMSVLLAAVATLGLGQGVAAHDEISSSDPENRAELDDPISDVTVEFGAPVDGIELALIDPDDREIQGTVVILSDTSARLEFETISQKGQYIVQYLAVEQGHLVSGAFSFTYGSAGSSGAGVLTWILLGAATVVILGIGGYLSLRRSRELAEAEAA